MKIFLLAFITILHISVGQNECLPTTCGPSSPPVRFPFWLKGQQPEHCGLPGFGLSCNQSRRIDFDLQFPATASSNYILLSLKMTVAVWDIDYKAQKMLAGYARPRSCLPQKLPTVNSSASASPFEVQGIGYGEGSTLFNCSNAGGYETIACLSSRHYKVINFASMYDISSLPPFSSCFKMYNISYLPDGALTGRDDEYGPRFYLSWSRPSCGKCEAEGKYCRLQNGEETECFGLQHSTVTGASRNHKPLIAGITAGIILLALITMASLFIFRVIKRKMDDERRIENAIKSHKNMRPRRYSYADVKRVTNNFKEKLSQDSQGKLHKGMLNDGTPVAVKVVDGCEQNVEDFMSEVERIGRMQHANILQLIGYSVDRHRRALIYEYMLMSSENQNHTLHQIALGIAKGIEYVLQESTQNILNLVGSPESILVDRDFNPKIVVATTEGALECIAPELFSSWCNIIPEKAYCYGFGMLLLDMVGRSGELHFSQLESREGEAIQIEEEEDGNENELVKKLSIIGLWCIQWFPSDRPSMKAVIQMLQQQTMPAMPPNPFSSQHNKLL